MKTSPSVNSLGRFVSPRVLARRFAQCAVLMGALSLLTGGVASAADQDVSGSINYTSSISVPSGQTVQVATGSAFNATYSLRATATGYSDAITFSVMAQKGAGPAYVTILSQKCVGTPLLVNPRVLESGSGTAMHLVITVNVPASVTLVGGATGTQTNLALSTSLPTFDTPSVTTISTVLSSYNGTMGVGTPYPQTTLQVTAGGNVGGAGGEIGISANFDRAPMFTIKGSLLGTGSGGDSGDVYFNLRSMENVALAPAMTFLRGGNVGVGTTPATKFHVAGAASNGLVTARVENTSVGTASVAGVQFKTGASSAVWQTFTRNGDFFAGIDSVGDYLTIKNGGNVGIGAPNPMAKLQINDSTSEVRIGNIGSADYAGVSFNGSLSLGSYNLASGIADKTLLLNRPFGSAIHFRENNDTPQMVIASGGSVGIGTSTPEGKFQVTGDAYFGTASGGYVTADTGTQMPNRLSLTLGKVGFTAALIANQSGGTDPWGVPNNAFGLVGYHAFPLIFGTTHAERMRITPDGAVGIGTTTVDSGIKLQVAGDIKVAHVSSESSTGAPAYYGRQVGSTFSQGTAAVFHGVTDNVTPGGDNWLIRGYRGSSFMWGTNFDGKLHWQNDTYLYRASSGVLQTDGRFTSSMLTVTASATLPDTSVTSLTSTGDVSTKVLTSPSAEDLQLKAGGLGQNVVLKPSPGGEVKIASTNLPPSTVTPSILRFTTSAVTDGFEVGLSAAGDARVWSNAADKGLLFGVANAERARFAASGNLLLGTTTDTASAGRLQIGTTSDLTATGGITFGTDTPLYRSGAAALKLDGLFTTTTLAVSQTSTFGGDVSITSTTGSISPTTGALKVAGGVGVTGDLNVGTDAKIVGRLGVGTSPGLGAKLTVDGLGQFTSGLDVNMLGAETVSLNVGSSSTAGGGNLRLLGSTASWGIQNVNGVLQFNRLTPAGNSTTTAAMGDAAVSILGRVTAQGITSTAGMSVTGDIQLSAASKIRGLAMAPTGSLLGTDAANVAWVNGQIPFQIDGNKVSLKDYNYNLGIGTFNPTYKLQVLDGNGMLLEYLTPNHGYSMKNFSGYLWTVGIGGSSEFKVTDGTYLNGGKDRLAISSLNGYVGLGTNSPQAPLHIVTENDAARRGAQLIISAPATPSGSTPDEHYVLFRNSNSANDGSEGLAAVGFSAKTNGAGRLWFGTSEAGSGVNHKPKQRMIINEAGQVGIGVSYGYFENSFNTGYLFSVAGSIHAKEVVVDITNWSDYVFSDTYRNAPLTEVEQHIKDHKHLPGVPSAKEVAEKGVDLGKMQAVLLAKIEELTLHMIAQEKRINRLEEENTALRSNAK